MVYAMLEKALRCSSLLDPTTHYATPLPRRPHHSAALTNARDVAAEGRTPEYNRLRHVSTWSENMRNAMLRASLHIRTRLLELTPAGETAAAWLTECVPNVPPSVWPGVSLRTCEQQSRTLQAARPAGVRLHGTAVGVRARCVVRARCSVPDVWYCVAVRTAALGPSPHRGDTAWLHRSAARLDPRGSRGGVGSVLAAAERRLACTDSGYHAVGTSPANRGRCTAAVVAFAQTTPRYLVRCGRCELRR